MPQITLDIRTLSFITTSIGILYAIGLLIFGRIQKIFKGFPMLATACASFGVGLFLLGFRYLLPDFITILVANTLITTGLVLYFEGTRQFLGVTDRFHPIGLVAILLHLGLFYYYTYPSPSVNNRIIVISMIAAFLSALSAREFLRRAGDGRAGF